MVHSVILGKSRPSRFVHAPRDSLMSGNDDTVRSKTYVLDPDEFEDSESITQLVQALEATEMQKFLASPEIAEVETDDDSTAKRIETNASRK